MIMIFLLSEFFDQQSPGQTFVDFCDMGLRHGPMSELRRLRKHGPVGDVAPTYSKKPFFLNPET